MNRCRCRRTVVRFTLLVVLESVSLGFLACAGSPTAATGTTTSTATIESVVTTFRGAVVESSPVVIESPEALDVEVKFTPHMPVDSSLTLYLCVLETASSIGVGTCNAISDTIAGWQARGNVARPGISTYKTGGVSTTTSYVYVGLTEGILPWLFTGASPPRVGEVFGNNRVLATFQAARTVTFR
jgi:hypothetical protein